MKTKFFYALCLVVLIFSVSFAQERYVKPVDEAQKDASFFAFRTKLIEAVKKRDAKYILSIVDPKISNTFGDDDGIRYFRNVWKLNSPNSEFWNEFLIVITHGGTFTKEAGLKTKQFCAPYTFNSFPDDLDVFEYQAIFGDNVNLRSKPETNAPIVANLSYNVVKVDFENSVKEKNKDNEFSWLKIQTLGGRRGFVKAEFVRSPIAYRACFEKKKGVWKMTAFIAGD